MLKIFSKNRLARQKRYTKAHGQSMVELAITLPVLLLLFSGLVEFGFILNYYLSLLDATRESARIYSTQDPFTYDAVNDVLIDNTVFYQSAASMVYTELAPFNEQDTSRRVILDPDTDDIIVSVFNVENTGPVNPSNVCNPAAPNPEKTITRHPSDSPTPGSFRYYENQTSGVSISDICAHLISGSSPTALLLVEVYYSYTPLLAITTPILNIAAVEGPLKLHAYTLMPMPPVSLASPGP
jgi:hypothetical protein